MSWRPTIRCSASRSTSTTSTGTPSLAQEIARAGPRILAFHVCDWLAPTTHMLLDRGMMGDGLIDIPHIRGLVEATGYDGPIEVEIFSRGLVAARSRPGAAHRDRTLPDRGLAVAASLAAGRAVLTFHHGGEIMRFAQCTQEAIARRSGSERQVRADCRHPCQRASVRADPALGRTIDGRQPARPVRGRDRRTGSAAWA